MGTLTNRDHLQFNWHHRYMPTSVCYVPRHISQSIIFCQKPSLCILNAEETRFSLRRSKSRLVLWSSGSWYSLSRFLSTLSPSRPIMTATLWNCYTLWSWWFYLLGVPDRKVCPQWGWVTRIRIFLDGPEMMFGLFVVDWIVSTSHYGQSFRSWLNVGIEV